MELAICKVEHIGSCSLWLQCLPPWQALVDFDHFQLICCSSDLKHSCEPNPFIINHSECWRPSQSLKYANHPICFRPNGSVEELDTYFLYLFVTFQYAKDGQLEDYPRFQTSTFGMCVERPLCPVPVEASCTSPKVIHQAAPRDSLIILGGHEPKIALVYMALHNLARTVNLLVHIYI